MPRFFAALRLPLVLLGALYWLLRGYLTMRLVFPRVGLARKQALTQAWARALLRLFRVEVDVAGSIPATGPLLLAANHISWLDILLLLAAAPVQFIARIENKHWPILGWMTQQAGAVFVQRQSARDMAKAIDQVSNHLRHTPAIIVLFPEGKTSDGQGVDTFHGNMLQAALRAHCPVQAVALDYRLQADGRRSSAPSYANPLNFQQSLLNTLGSGPYIARLRFAPPQEASVEHRKQLAAQLRAQVLAMREE